MNSIKSPIIQSNSRIFRLIFNKKLYTKYYLRLYMSIFLTYIENEKKYGYSVDTIGILSKLIDYEMYYRQRMKIRDQININLKIYDNLKTHYKYFD